VYARTVDQRTLTLSVSGMLWNRSLVMIDRETKSLWSHLLGRAMRGPLKGKDLQLLSGQMTDWKTWRERHPGTTVMVLKRTSKAFNREFYANPQRFVIGLVDGVAARAWPLDQLRKQPLVNDQLDDVPLLVWFEEESSTAYLFDRRAGDRTLRFERQDGKLIDRETASVWSAQHGRAIKGPLKNTQLEPLPGIVSFRKAWKVFHPKSTYFVVATPQEGY